MTEVDKEWYARRFGLPVEQIRYFDELNQEQKDQVAKAFGLWRAQNYIFAVKRDGDLVHRREKRNPLIERLGRW